jgi:hypothetical protein
MTKTNPPATLNGDGLFETFSLSDLEIVSDFGFWFSDFAAVCEPNHT